MLPEQMQLHHFTLLSSSHQNDFNTVVGVGEYLGFFVLVCSFCYLILLNGFFEEKLLLESIAIFL
jgi:hypothetical protein